MTWTGVPADHPFGTDNLPYGSALLDGRPAVVVRIGDRALDLTSAATGTMYEAVFADGTLDRLLAEGPATWEAVRAQVTEWLTDDAHLARVEPLLRPVAGLELRLPFAVADYVDFYASEHHATNVGRLFRPDAEPLTPNWRHLPIGYHGRAGTVVVSGTPIRRPSGQFRTGDDVVFGPSRRLDFEAEVGFVVGAGSELGQPVGMGAFAEHVFGVVLVNDWSARDIQAWEYVPLGPMLGKSFATSISAWVTPLAALTHAWTAAPAQQPEPLPYLAAAPRAGLDLTLEVRLNGELISSPPYAAMYWTPAQMLAHLTVNGASVRPGDLFASGTVSGPSADQRGCLLELTRGGSEPLTGSARTFLLDGDEVTITATFPGPGGGRLAFGEVTGVVHVS